MPSEDMTALAPGDEIELVAGDVAHGGWCVARLDGPIGSGPVVFVRYTLPGERVRARVTEVTSRFARADAVQILAPAPGRVEPPCPYAHPGGCGGCDWQHASLPTQRALKADVVAQQLRRIAGIDWPPVVEALPGDRTGDPDPGLGWRTRVTFAVRPDGVAGLRGHRSHQVVEIDDCLIAHPRIRELGVTRRRWLRARSVEVVTGTGGPERAVIVTGGRPSAGAGGWADLPAEAVLGQVRGRTTVYRGRSYLSERAAGRSWRVSAPGFWQVHPAVASTLAEAVLDALRPQPGDTALDLYCGAGLFTGVLAAAVGPDGAVAGVEADRAAVRDARRNLRDTPWATVYPGDVGQVLARHQPGLAPARLTVLDPPRAGVSRDVIDYLGRPAPSGGGQRIAYVSCDPATLARDIGLLLPHGWRLDALRAFDAFPMTHHVECLATLVRD